MNDEALQQRLRRLDPTEGTSIEPATGPRAAVLMEQIMNTPTTNNPELAEHPSPARRWPKFVLAGGAAVAILGGGAFAVGSFGGSSSKAPTTVEFSMGEPVDPMLSMCLPVTDYVPVPGLVGFRGTVTDVADGTVTVDVGEWFAGGDADQVLLSTEGLGSPALDGIEFVEGGEYLVAVFDGTVLTCGLSGQAEPTLEGIYQGWFGA